MNTPSVKGQIYIESMVPLAMTLGMSLGPILERHNAFQWTLPLPPTLPLPLGVFIPLGLVLLCFALILYSFTEFISMDLATAAHAAAATRCVHTLRSCIALLCFNFVFLYRIHLSNFRLIWWHKIIELCWFFFFAFQRENVTLIFN